jgi:hypothetical protein
MLGNPFSTKFASHRCSPLARNHIFIKRMLQNDSTSLKFFSSCKSASASQVDFASITPSAPVVTEEERRRVLMEDVRGFLLADLSQAFKTGVSCLYVCLLLAYGGHGHAFRRISWLHSCVQIHYDVMGSSN